MCYGLGCPNEGFNGTWSPKFYKFCRDENNTEYCSSCGIALSSDEVYSFNDKIYCNTCYNDIIEMFNDQVGKYE